MMRTVVLEMGRQGCAFVRRFEASRRLLGVVLLAMLATGCAGYPKAKEPMPIVTHLAGERRADTLIVFLPGRKDHAGIFEREGFVDAVRKRKLRADLVETDAHIGYYVRGSLLRRLRLDVMEPARKRGYRRIILVGVSLGGYGAVRYAMRYPGEISQLVLLAPFLGTGAFMNELADAGDEDYAQTWDWLRHYPVDASAEKRSAAGYPRIVLGYGREDLLLITDRALRELLPADDVITLAGVHIWHSWRLLFEEILEKGLLDDKSR